MEKETIDIWKEKLLGFNAEQIKESFHELLGSQKNAFSWKQVLAVRAAMYPDIDKDAEDRAQWKKDSVDIAIETLGGSAFTKEQGLLNLWSGARLLKTAPVSKEMILNFIAEWELGLPKSY